MQEGLWHVLVTLVHLIASVMLEYCQKLALILVKVMYLCIKVWAYLVFMTMHPNSILRWKYLTLSAPYILTWSSQWETSDSVWASLHLNMSILCHSLIQIMQLSVAYLRLLRPLNISPVYVNVSAVMTCVVCVFALQEQGHRFKKSHFFIFQKEPRNIMEKNKHWVWTSRQLRSKNTFS